MLTAHFFCSEDGDFKARVADELLAAVERRWPGLVGDVAVQDIATPVTNSFYAGAYKGGAYGPAGIPEQFGKNAWGTRTPIDGLFLAGAGVFGGGVAPCLYSGLAAAAAANKRAGSRARRRAPGVRWRRASTPTADSRAAATERAQRSA